MMELMTGEAGVLRTALGVVLAREGIDVRVRVYLWNGGVEDVVLPTMGAQPVPVGAQVVVMFLSDRPASGMVIGTIEGLLSWRRTEAPAFVDYMQPYMQETIAKAGELDETLTVTEGAFVAEEGLGLFGGAVLMADGRVFFVPGQTGGGSEVIKPHIWDPYTGGIHLVDVPWEAGAGDEFLGGCLLQDGRVFFMPHPWSTTGQAYLYDPDRDCLLAGRATVGGRVLRVRAAGGWAGAAGAAHRDEPADLRPEGGHDHHVTGRNAGGAADGPGLLGRRTAA